MGFITNIVREIAIIVILASFLEMLLPKSNMKRFVQVVLGLFILISILTPIANLISGDELAYHIEAWQYHPETNYQLEEILAQGQRISQANQKTTIREYEMRLEKQITSLIQLVPEVNYTDVTVAVDSDTKKNTYGKIREIYIDIYHDNPNKIDDGASLQENIEIEQIVISINHDSDQVHLTALQQMQSKQSQQSKEIVNLISNFYGVSADKIKVNYR